MKTDFPKICCKKDKVLQQTPLSVSRGSDIEGQDVVRASFLKSRLLLTETVELHLIDLFYFFHDEFHLSSALCLASGNFSPGIAETAVVHEHCSLNRLPILRYFGWTPFLFMIFKRQCLKARKTHKANRRCASRESFGSNSGWGSDCPQLSRQ